MLKVLICFLQKLLERKSIFEKGTFRDIQDKEKWKCVLSMEYMSSDESSTEGDKEIIFSHPLPWLSPNVQHLKRTLDETSKKEKSPQARRMVKDRVEGSYSSRPRPVGTNIPSWDN